MNQLNKGFKMSFGNINSILGFKKEAETKDGKVYFNDGIVIDAPVSIQDLSWLSVDQNTYRDNEYLPSNESTLNSKLELEEQWNSYRKNRIQLQNSPKEKILNDDIRILPSSGKVNRTHPSDIVRLAKKLANEGKNLEDIDSIIKSNYTPNQISSVTEKLKKVASDFGLLRHLFIDMEPYGSCFKSEATNARKRLKKSSTNSEYVLETPDCKKCPLSKHHASYCSSLDMKIVKNIPYDEIKNPILDNLVLNGKISSDVKEKLKISKLSSKDQLKTAFLYSPQKQNSFSGVMTPVRSTYIPKKYASFPIQKDPIRTKILKAMNEGKFGNELTAFINASFDEKTIETYKDVIAECRSEEGLLGVIYTDPDFFDSCDSMINHWKKSGIDPKIVFVRTNSRCSKCANGNCSKINKPIANGLEYEWEGVASVIDEMVLNKKISADKARFIYEKYIDPKQALQAAVLATKDKKPEVVGGKNVKIHVVNAYENKYNVPTENKNSIISKTANFISNGKPIAIIKRDLRNQFSFDETNSILKSAFESISNINATKFPNCDLPFSLNKKASLIKDASCETCVFNQETSCSKLGTFFSNYKTKKANIRVEQNDLDKFDLKPSKLEFTIPKNSQKTFDVDSFTGLRTYKTK